MKHSMFILATVAIISACSTKKDVSGNYPKETECLGVELDGSQTLKTWGFGSTRKDAIEQAKKNAVRDVLFKSIRNGKPDCNQVPVLTEADAQTKYEDYFNRFFTDGGAYAKFISMKDEPVKIPAKYRHSSTDGVEFGVVVRVMRAQLKKQMTDDEIIKPQD